MLPDWGERALDQTVCAGDHWTPTLAGLDGTFAVGCVPTGSQQMFPTVHFVDGMAGELAQDTRTIRTVRGSSTRPTPDRTNIRTPKSHARVTRS